MITPSRRKLLGGALGLGALFLGSPVLAAETGGRKLIVVILRGAMDGLSAAPPLNDPDYARLRGAIAIPANLALPLTDGFGLHPKLATLHALAQSGQVRIAPAAALPARIRSHFEAQDLLESGGARLDEVSSGWLNRALASKTGAPIEALSIGPQEPLILRGKASIRSWSPGGRSLASQERLLGLLQNLYGSDPLLGPALASGVATEREADQLQAGAGGPPDARAFGRAAAKFLADAGGPDIAVISLDGFDTHASQGAAEGQLAQRLANLDGLVAGAREGLGDAAWDRTVVLAVTEFGRTARVNGTRGTDHGTASTLILAGGALRPGGIVGDWPTLREDRLFENRDLAPTIDVRSVFKAVLRDHLAIAPAALDASVFPESRSAPAVSGLIRA